MKYLPFPLSSRSNWVSPHASKIIARGSTPYVNQFENIKTGPVLLRVNSIIEANLVE